MLMYNLKNSTKMKKRNFTITGLTVIFALVAILFINASKKDEHKDIIRLLESERQAFMDNNYEGYAAKWVKDNSAGFMWSSMEEYYAMQGWDEISSAVKEHMDWKIENNIKNYENPKNFKYNHFVIEGDLAWVNFTYYDDKQNEKDRRNYVLKRVDKEWKILNINILVTDSYAEGKFVVDANQAPEVTHVNLKDFPKDKVFPMIEGWGGMCVDINTAPAGTEFSPLLEGLKNDHCQVPHWGYIVKGAIRMDYEDGTQDIFRAGEAFYMKPGHTGGVEEDLLLVSFGPEEGIKHLVSHFEKKVAEMQASGGN